MSPTRRNLFGPIDREQLRVEYKAALQKDLEEASRCWGFDFILNKPLEGSKYQWESVPGTKVPLLYRSCGPVLEKAEGQKVAEESISPKGERVEPAPSEKEYIPRSSEGCTLSMTELQKTPEKSEHTRLKRKQTNITDFYQAKRRVVWTPRKSGQ
ncbi:cyclin-dependent kinase inhibitor 1 isoform X2 [Thalassophryne amazonica]|nr:cyclin-dependent kinase inhibitor 1 isoform X2 [Thalassophryne amazonica]XP_034022466.1 cyclin-dependent kinase inhibitor 1 isoform X2 [Thalassophryne amazonica]